MYSDSMKLIPPKQTSAANYGNNSAGKTWNVFCNDLRNTSNSEVTNRECTTVVGCKRLFISMMNSPPQDALYYPEQVI